MSSALHHNIPPSVGGVSASWHGPCKEHELEDNMQCRKASVSKLGVDMTI